MTAATTDAGLFAVFCVPPKRDPQACALAELDARLNDDVSRGLIVYRDPIETFAGRLGDGGPVSQALESWLAEAASHLAYVRQRSEAVTLIERGRDRTSAADAFDRHFPRRTPPDILASDDALADQVRRAAIGLVFAARGSAFGQMLAELRRYSAAVVEAAPELDTCFAALATGSVQARGADLAPAPSKNSLDADSIELQTDQLIKQVLALQNALRASDAERRRAETRAQAAEAAVAVAAAKP